MTPEVQICWISYQALLRLRIAMAASLCRRPIVGLRAPASTPKACLPYALPLRSLVANVSIT
jgi:hypothetical protein